jgi:hypothetical protein
MEFLGLAAPEWFLSSQSFHFINKYLVFLFFAFKDIFVAHKHTHLVVIEVNIYFQLVSERVHLCLDLFSKVLSMISSNINLLEFYEYDFYDFSKDTILIGKLFKKSNRELKKIKQEK